MSVVCCPVKSPFFAHFKVLFTISLNYQIYKYILHSDMQNVSTQWIRKNRETLQRGGLFNMYYLKITGNWNHTYIIIYHAAIDILI